MTDAVLHAVLRAAIEATAADLGWVVARRGDDHRVLVALGGDRPGDLVGHVVGAGSPAAACIATGQPAARRLRGDEASAQGAAGATGVPAALLTVPCADAPAAIELARLTGDGFGIDDIELVTILADIAGAALDEDDPTASLPSPDELAAELRRLHTADRSRYSLVARVVSTLLGAS
jgi:hypothetical protein